VAEPFHTLSIFFGGKARRHQERRERSTPRIKKGATLYFYFFTCSNIFDALLTIFFCHIQAPSSSQAPRGSKLPEEARARITSTGGGGEDNSDER